MLLKDNMNRLVKPALSVHRIKRTVAEVPKWISLSYFKWTFIERTRTPKKYLKWSCLLLPTCIKRTLVIKFHHPTCKTPDSLWRIVGRLGERKRKRVCSHRPPRALCFSIIANFIGIPSGSLCGGESYLLQSLKVLYLKCDSKLKDPHALQFMNLNSNL